jgi:hypothetical protein
VHRSHRYVPRTYAPQILQLRLRGLELGQDSPGAANEQLAGIGDRHAAGRPFDQRYPKLVLEPADLLGQGRLGDVLTFSGASEMPLVSKRDEVAKLANIHKQNIWITDDTRLGHLKR